MAAVFPVGLPFNPRPHAVSPSALRQSDHVNCKPYVCRFIDARAYRKSALTRFAHQWLFTLQVGRNQAFT